MKFEEKIKLLSKAASINSSDELLGTEVQTLAKLLDVDQLFKNFPEKELRNFRQELSGQPISGMRVNRDSKGNVVSFSFIPHNESRRVELYDGLIFSFINPAARSLASIMAWMSPSSYSRMKSIAEIAAWGYIADSLVKVREWSHHLDIVRNPGEILYPMVVTDTTDLLQLDILVFSKSSVLMENCLDRLAIEEALAI